MRGGRVFFVRSGMVKQHAASCSGSRRVTFCQLSLHMMATLFPPTEAIEIRFHDKALAGCPILGTSRCSTVREITYVNEAPANTQT